MDVEIRPLASFDMKFTGALGTMTFKCVEEKASRNTDGSNKISYDVFADPVNDTLFTHAVFSEAERDEIGNEKWSDEVLIGWNVWETASWSFWDGTLVKKWPPVCTRISHNSYKVDIHYDPLFITNFETTPITVKRFSSFDVAVLDFHDDGSTAWIALGALSADKQQALHYINVDSKGKTQGVNIIEPSFSWTERWTWGPVKSLVPEEFNYIDLLTQITGTVNLSKFRGFKAREILFQGGSGRYVGPMTWEIDYKFSRRPTRKDLEVGGIIKTKPVEFQGPWDIEDFQTSTKTEVQLDPDGRKYIIEKPDLVKVHKVYKDWNFNELEVYGDIPLGEARVWENEGLQVNPPRLGPFNWFPPEPRPVISNQAF